MGGRPQTCDGDGGIGKSVVSVGMVVARAAGVPIFGKKTIQGPCLFVTHEDDEDDIQSMAQALCGGERWWRNVKSRDGGRLMVLGRHRQQVGAAQQAVGGMEALDAKEIRLIEWQ